MHVASDNTAALRLYQVSGFEVEAEEGAAAARALGRQRRLLLRLEWP